MRKLRTLLTALAVAGAVTATPAQSSGQWSPNTRRDIDTTFFFSKIGTLVVGNGAANVVVTGWDQTSIRIKAHTDEGSLKFEAASSRAVVETSRGRDSGYI